MEKINFDNQRDFLVDCVVFTTVKRVSKDVLKNVYFFNNSDLNCGRIATCVDNIAEQNYARSGYVSILDVNYIKKAMLSGEGIRIYNNTYFFHYIPAPKNADKWVDASKKILDGEALQINNSILNALKEQDYYNQIDLPNWIGDFENLVEAVEKEWKDLDCGHILNDTEDLGVWAEDFMQQCGYVNSDLPLFIVNHIDWEGAAKDILQDYSVYEVCGTEYYIR